MSGIVCYVCGDIGTFRSLTGDIDRDSQGWGSHASPRREHRASNATRPAGETPVPLPSPEHELISRWCGYPGFGELWHRHWGGLNQRIRVRGAPPGDHSAALGRRLGARFLCSAESRPLELLPHRSSPRAVLLDLRRRVEALRGLRWGLGNESSRPRRSRYARGGGRGGHAPLP